MLETGLNGRCEMTVTERDTARTYGSGTLDVFGTPAMIALMEKTALESIAPHLQEGEGSVGTKLNVSHVAATPLGKKVWCESELTQIDRRRLTFAVKVFDEAGLVGEGTHERFIINSAAFMEKAAGRA